MGQFIIKNQKIITEECKMEKYAKPAMEIVSFEENDIIRTSGLENGDGPGENEKEWGFTELWQ